MPPVCLSQDVCSEARLSTVLHKVGGQVHARLSASCRCCSAQTEMIGDPAANKGIQVFCICILLYCVIVITIHTHLIPREPAREPVCPHFMESMIYPLSLNSTTCEDRFHPPLTSYHVFIFQLSRTVCKCHDVVLHKGFCSNVLCATVSAQPCLHFSSICLTM